MSPSARRPSSCPDDDNEEANVRANVDVATGYANVRASAVITDDDNDDNANNDDFPGTLGAILGAPFMATAVLDLDLAFGVVAFEVVDHTLLLFPLPSFPLHSPLLFHLLLLGSPPEIQDFSLSLSSFSPFNGCFVLNFPLFLLPNTCQRAATHENT